MPKIEVGMWIGNEYIKVGNVDFHPPRGQATDWHINVDDIDRLMQDGLVEALDKFYRDGKIIQCD